MSAILTIKILGDAKDATKALTSTADEAQDFGSKTSRMFNNMKGPALGAFAAIGGAAIAAGAAMVEFGQAAWQDKQEADKLAFTLQKIPAITQDMIDANEDWITSTMFATHVLDTDLREAVGQLAVATGDLGQAQELAALAADVATGANEEYGTVVDKLAKAVAGNTDALKRQMPWLDANKDGTLTLDEAVQGLTEAYGGAAEAAAQNDPWTTLQIIFDELKESLGQALLPLMEELADWFKDPANQQKVKEFIDKIGNLAREFGQKLLPAIESLIDYLGSPKFKAQMKVTGDIFVTIWRIINNVTQAVSNFIAMLGRIPSNIRNFDLGSPEKAAFVVPVAASPVRAPSIAATASGSSGGAGGGVVINFNGVVTDPEATGREILRILKGTTVRTGLAPAEGSQW